MDSSVSEKILVNDFEEYFHQYYPGIVVSVNPLVPAQLLNQYLESGRIIKIRFIRFSIPADIADAYDIDGQAEEGGSSEYIVSARRNGRLPLVSRIREFLDGKRKLNSLIELQNFEYDSVKVEVNIGGTRRTLDLSDLSKLRPYYDISSGVKIGDNGHPTYTSIDAIARTLTNDLLASMGLSVPND